MVLSLTFLFQIWESSSCNGYDFLEVKDFVQKNKQSTIKMKKINHAYKYTYLAIYIFLYSDISAVQKINNKININIFLFIWVVFSSQPF